MTVEARHLRCFLAIAEEGNVTRAAERLHLSQPALSRALAQLERELGVKLIDRSTHHLQLTEAGERFRREAAKGLLAFDAAIASLADQVPAVRFGHAWAAATHVSIIARAWNAANPGRPLVIRRSDDRLAGLANGDVDIALLRGPVSDRSLRTVLIEEELRLAVLPAGHPLAGASALTLESLAEERLVVNSRAGSTTPALWPLGRQPTVAVDVSSTEDWLIEVANGTGIGVTAASTALLHPHPDVRFIPLTDAPTIPLLLAWPAHSPHPNVSTLVRIARRATSARRPSA